MSQSTPTLTIEINGEENEFEPSEISELIGEQLIMEERDDRAYIAGLAFDHMESGKDSTATVMEFLRNSPKYEHIDSEQLDIFEKVLRGQIDYKL